MMLREGNVFTPVCHSVHRGSPQTSEQRAPPSGQRTPGQRASGQRSPGQKPPL